MKKPFVITISVSKGGAGKTSVTSLMFSILADKGFKVLAIDTDPQANLTNYSGVRINPQDKVASSKTTKEFILNSFNPDFDPTEYIVETEYENMHIIPAESNSMESMDREINLQDLQREFYMKRAIEVVASMEFYDFILIDTPPALAISTMNSYVASDLILIPVACEAFSLDALGPTYGACIRAKTQVNPDLEIAIVLNLVDARKNITRAVIEAVEETSDYIRVLDTRLRVDSKIGDSQLERVPLYELNKRTRLIVDAQKLVEEVFEIAASK